MENHNSRRKEAKFFKRWTLIEDITIYKTNRGADSGVFARVWRRADKGRKSGRG
jgi:hypothetical protein